MPAHGSHTAGCRAVGFESFFGDLETETRLVRQFDEPINEFQRLDEQALACAASKLVDQEIRRRCHHLNGCRDADWIRRGVWCQCDVVDLGQGGNLAHFQNVAAVANIRRQDSGSFFFDDLSETPSGRVSFPGGDGDRGGTGDFPQCIHILRVGGLLDKQ